MGNKTIGLKITQILDHHGEHTQEEAIRSMDNIDTKGQEYNPERMKIKTGEEAINNPHIE